MARFAAMDHQFHISNHQYSRLMRNMVASHSARAREIGPGAFLLKRHLSLEVQRDIARLCRGLLDGDVPAYVPVVRGGGRMHVRMLCLGRHWNARTYQYEPTRSDFDDQPAPPIPPALA